mmetsp:Transcript_8820/g.30300  ORF Transcript_8820/g.30300 Transcript_8820/m.30300 type:complete len:216 (+) Transcript_8820:210-857(+)
MIHASLLLRNAPLERLRPQLVRVVLPAIDLLPVPLELLHHRPGGLLLRHAVAPFPASKQVHKVPGVQGLHAGILHTHYGLRDADLEALHPHQPLLVRVLDDGPEDVHGGGLAQAVRPVHGLHVHHRVPVVLEEEDGVRGGQVEPQPPDPRRQQEHGDGGIPLKLHGHLVAPLRVHVAVQPQVRDSPGVQHAPLHSVQGRLGLGEDQNLVRGGVQI